MYMHLVASFRRFHRPMLLISSIVTESYKIHFSVIVLCSLDDCHISLSLLVYNDKSNYGQTVDASRANERSRIIYWHLDN